MQKTFNGCYEVLPNYKELDKKVHDLMEHACRATQDSYSPYSLFKVGAAVELDNGEIIAGSNQENIAFPAGLCAERVTLHAAIQQYPHVHIKAMALIAMSRDKWTSKPVTPCGVCRQTMLEFIQRQKKSFPLYLGTHDGETLLIPQVEFLMPLSFFQDGLLK